ncbi:MAG TPA: ATP-binding protein [Pseudomonadales bacterium]|nr:ATP-binding protein [Pseudomonadales bacterium]
MRPSPRPPRSVTVQALLLTLVLAPILTVCVALALFGLAQRFDELETNLQRHAESLLHELAGRYQLLLRQPDPAQLQRLAGDALSDDHLRALHLFNAERQPWIQAGVPLSADRSGLPLTLSNHLEQQQQDDLLRLSLPLGNVEQPSGWLVLEFSRLPTRLAQYQVVFYLLATTVAALLLGLLITLVTTRRLLRPLQQLMVNAERLAAGQPVEPLSRRAPREFLQINQQVEHLGERLAQMRDETQQAIEQSTRDLRQTLETVEIQNIELDLARRESQKASLAKTRFLADTSHELRTPLNGIIGFANLLLKSPLNEAQRDYLQVIQRSSSDLLAIINDILDFSKIEANKLVLDRVPFNLRELIEETLLLLATHTFDKPLELVPLIHADVPVHLVGDPLRLKQVLTNLVGNAIKFTPAGSVVIEVRVEQSDAQGALLRVRVIDTGIGIEPEQQQRIFEAFQQQSPTHGGAGLGLIIAKQLVEQMEGAIGLEQSSAQGSCFWFTLPVTYGLPTSFKAAQLPFNGEPVLLFDTLAASCTAIAAQLEALGLQPQRHEQADSFMAALTQQHWFAVLLGITPPCHPDTIAALRSQVRRHHAGPLLVLSCQALRSGDALPFNDPAMLILGKPAQSRKLAQSLLQLRGSQPIQPPATAAPRILAVDDNETNLRLLELLLQQLGAEVELASSGAEAIALVSHTRFDLVLLDLRMPGIDGIETARQLRTLPLAKDPRLPIIVVSAHLLDEERHALSQAGIDDALLKPIDERALRALLSRWIQQPLPIAPANGVVDREEAIRLAGNQPELAERLLNQLIDSLTAEQQRFSALLSQGDLTALLEAVHRLHGACCYCGVPALRMALRAAEAALKQSHTAELPRLMAQIDSEIDALLDWQRSHTSLPTMASGG